jgi:hypothetical protein
MQGSPRNTGRWTMTGRLLLGMMALTVAGACASDQAVAPEATSAPAGPAALAPAAGGAELLVLVDEKGAARRVLIVRGERDPRRREVERLGFRTLTQDAVTRGEVNAATQELFPLEVASGVTVSYRQVAAAWNAQTEALVERLAGSRNNERPGPSLAAYTVEGATAHRASVVVDSALRALEAQFNEVLAVTAASGVFPASAAADHGHQANGSTRHLSMGADGPCDKESRNVKIALAAYSVTMRMALGGIVAATPTGPGLLAAVGIGAFEVGVAYWALDAAMDDWHECQAKHGGS